MNNGPNLIGMFVIGLTAGVSAFGLYMGYKHIEKNNKSNKKSDNVINDLSKKKFDAERTLQMHKGERTKLRTETIEINDSVKNGSKLVKEESDNNNSNKKKKEVSDNSVNKKSSKKSEKKSSSKLEKNKKKVSKKSEKETSSKLEKNKEDELPEVMNTKKTLSSHEDIEESLLELPNKEEGEYASKLLVNETIRTIDKVNLKKRKKRKSKKKELKQTKV